MSFVLHRLAQIWRKRGANLAATPYKSEAWGSSMESVGDTDKHSLRETFLQANSQGTPTTGCGANSNQLRGGPKMAKVKSTRAAKKLVRTLTTIAIRKTKQK